MLCVGFRSRPVTRVPRSSIVPPGLAFVFMVHLPSLLANIPHITHLDPDERLGPIDFPWNTWGPTSTRYFKVADNDHYTFNQLHFPSNGTHVLLGNLLLDFNQLDIARDISHVLSRQTTGHGTIFKRSPLVNNTSFKQGKAKNIRVPEYPGRIVRCPTVIPRGWMFKEEVITALPYRETSIPTPFKPGSLESFACHTRVASVIPHFKVESPHQTHRILHS
ncbi:hypothetical protein PHLCEN_2v10298 [Hermanssonia centrifuga]|uniref:Uncharacterized protein n=1 Tax=Hermanssonia centrifuga TaxID=98765 RepID=A0A2R6NN94_9APHY|nr:hypothetical protein PHLCEN_2v10298 [Hermanssonia centrifuga]